MSHTQNIETPHERRSFTDHGHMDVITLDPRHTLTVGDEPCAPLDTGVAAYAKPS